ncbi:MAG: hypothetical protein FRX49_08057 [Trebouxia sp. A1-2]|nr:MAG: hypothetical protein FRX49_08057 [Trebouxia sp. A1-2]
MATPDSGWNSNGGLIVVAAAASLSALSQRLSPGRTSMLKLRWRAAADHSESAAVSCGAQHSAPYWSSRQPFAVLNIKGNITI